MRFPDQFLAHIRVNPGFDEAAFIQAHEEPASISIRYNPFKPMSRLCDYPVPWSQYGCYLQERPTFALDPLFHAGAYYVQEASSMFLETILKTIGVHQQPQRILDLCAALGGKSTLIASTMHPDSVLFSNEVIKSRVPALKENLTKWGAPNVIITQNDAADYGALDAFFDVMVVDAPCSGSGMFRKDAHAADEWSVENVMHCSRRQQRILQDSIPALKPGGWLIYATCSYSQEENEHIVASLIDDGWNPLSGVPEYPGVYTSSSGFRFYPDKVNGEGFYIAALQKPIDDIHKSQSTGRMYKNSCTPALQFPTEWIAPEYTIAGYEWRNTLYGFSPAIQAVLPYAEQLNLQQIGIPIGEYKRDDLIPDHAFAMSTLVHADIQRIEVDLETALHFLRKNTIHIETPHPGWALITFKQMALGWIKVIPGRINNYYPTEWRLRK